jgi:hypothetical protein
MPLTEMQRTVIDEVEKAQHEVRRAGWWRRLAKWTPSTGIIDREVATEADGIATAYELQAQSLVEPPISKSEPAPHVISGGPATTDEIYEAEMHPWPEHGMADTIERNRGLLQDQSESNVTNDPTVTQSDP